MEASRRRQDVRAVAVFLVLVTALSAVFDYGLVSTGSLWAWNGWAVFLLMWSPGVAGLLASLIVYRSLAPLGLLGNRRVFGWTALCILVPALYTALIYPGLQALGIVGISTDRVNLAFIAVGLLLSARSALGEELGWRGFASPVFTRLFGFRTGQLLLGLIWYLYHVPALLFTQYGTSPHVLFGNAMFLIAVVGLSFFLGWARQQSDSVWPSTFFHASHNLIFLYAFEPVVQKTALASWLVGEQGAAAAAALVMLGAVALALSRNARAAAAP